MSYMTQEMNTTQTEMYNTYYMRTFMRTRWQTYAATSWYIQNAKIKLFAPYTKKNNINNIIYGKDAQMRRLFLYHHAQKSTLKCAKEKHERTHIKTTHYHVMHDAKKE